MGWKIWKNTNAGKLPQAMSRQLGSHYSLSQEMLDRLMYASRPGQFVGTKTTFIRIFDPSLLENTAQAIRRYKDLDAHKSAIHFEGRWQSGGLADVSDLRTAKGSA